MKSAHSYIKEFDPALERLEALILRVQEDALAEGARIAAVQMFEIAERTDRRVRSVTEPHNSMAAK